MKYSNLLCTVVVSAVGLMGVCCSTTSAGKQFPTATPTPPTVSNSNANAHLYALDEPKPPPSKAVKVSAKVMWLDTGIELKEGQKFMIVASGQWSVGKNSFGAIGTVQDCKKCIVPEANLGALVAKIGNEAFIIGDRMQMPSPGDGRLFLSINDTPNQFSDNRNHIVATITYGTRPK